jgi:hypothetical protein
MLGVLLCNKVFLVQPLPGAPPRTVPWRDSQLGTHFTVDIHELTGLLRDMPSREARDQLRDWALYGVLHYQGNQGEALLKVTHESYPLRLPYLEEMFVFAHGPGRRAILDDQTVVLVYEKSERDPVAVLGRMADQVRMELGEAPSNFQVFAFEADVPRGMLRVERMPDLKAEQLYGPDYGYAEARIHEPNHFKCWLESIDDVTYARHEGRTLLLGGRRFPNSRTRSVTLEDVAALYQAHDTLTRERQALGSELRSKQHLEEYVARGGRLPPAEPGFSLDSQYRQEQLGASLELLARAPCELLRDTAELGRRAASEPEDARTEAMWSALSLWKRTSETPAGKLAGLCSSFAQLHGEQLAAISQAVRSARDRKAVEVALVPLWALLERMRRSAETSDIWMRGVLEHVLAKDAVQCARYDGPLQGTRVGMNLFYTDLLAKLWIIDHHHSAPSTSVSGFLSPPRLPASPLEEEEIATNPSTRIWFGPKQGSYSVEEDRALFFRHVATRVYAASSNPLNPGKESSPAELNRRVIGWWNRHYAEVADFEQEYHLQNEIMKWSILTGWLHSRSAPVQFLSNVHVNKDLTFDRWFEASREGLRYQHSIQLLPREQWLKGRECLPKLSSYVSQLSGYQVTGGVSLGGARSLESAPRLSKHLDASQRYGLGLKAVTRNGDEELISRALPHFEPDGRVLVTATKGTRTRLKGAEFQLPHLELKYVASKPQKTQLQLSGAWDVGEFALWTHPFGVSMHFEPGSVEQARFIMSAALSQNGVNGSWGHMVIMGEKSLLHPQGATDRFIRVTSGSSVKDALMTIRRDGALDSIHASIVDADGALASMAHHGWQYLEPRRSDDRMNVLDEVKRVFSDEAPPPDSPQVILTGLSGSWEELPVFITPDGRLAIARPSRPELLETWTDIVQHAALSPRDIQGIAAQSQLQPTKMLSWDLTNRQLTEKAYNAVRDGAPGQFAALESLARVHPGGWTKAVKNVRDTALANGKYALSTGRPAEAVRIFDAVGQRLGDSSPEVLMLKALAQMEAGLSQPGLDNMVKALAALWKKPDGKQVIEQLVPLVDDVNLRDVKGMLQSDMGLGKALAQGLNNGVHLKAHDTEVVSTLKIDGPLNGHVLTPDERQALLENNNAVIYIDDRFSMNRVDFESAPAENLAELASNPYVSWQAVEGLPTGSYSPTRVVADLGSNTESYTKVVDLREPLLDRSEDRAVIRVVIQPMVRAVLIPNCNANRDRDVSSEEGERCQCPN